MARNSGRFRFDGGAATYLGTGLLGFLITVCTLGICYPFALVLVQRWRAKHSYIDGQRLIFTGSAIGLFGSWIKWFFLCIITVGIYGFWVGPRIARWKWEHMDFDPAYRQNAVGGSGHAALSPIPTQPTPALGSRQTSGELQALPE
jgi:uncharacterized membrane protein YjgN (DUF898 family)